MQKRTAFRRMQKHTAFRRVLYFYYSLSLTIVPTRSSINAQISSTL